MPNIEKKIFIHHNYNRNEIRQVLLENYSTMPKPNIGEDKGLIYYDTFLDRVMVWDGTVWKIVRWLDDRDIVNTQDVLVENLWVESDLIPTVLGNALNSPLVQTTTASTTYINNSYSYQLPYDPRIVPTKYGSFYEPVLYTYDNQPIPSGYNNWRIDGDKLTFYGGFSDSPLIIDPLTPPKVVYWKYTGRTGTFKFVGGATNILEVNGFTNVISLPSFVRTDNIISLTINGIHIYAYTYDENTSQITIDEFAIGYQVESDDLIRIELNV